MENLSSVLISYSIMNFLSLLFAIIFYLGNRKHKAFLYNIYYWLSICATFFAQGLLDQNYFLITLGFAISGFVMQVLGLFIQEITDVKLPMKQYAYCNLIAPLLSGLLYLFNASFTVLAFPVALSLSMTTVHAVIFAWRKGKRQTFSTRLFLFIMLTFSAHLADFPWLRLNEDFALPAFYIAFVYGIFTSILIPYIINEQIQNKYNEELEDEVREKTKEISELAETRKIVSQLLAHDSSNYVYLIYQLSVFVEKGIKIGEIPRKYQKWAKVAAKGYSQQREMTIKARELIAADSGKMTYKMEAFNLLNAIIASVDSFRHRAEEKGVTIEYKCPHNYNIIADKTLFSSSILNNLISNSIKFCSPGEKIKIRAFQKGDEITIVHYDQGPGIPEHKRSKVFSAGEDTSTLGTEGEKGSGFGLPIVYNLVSNLKGSLELRSRCGNGHMTMFILRFPKGPFDDSSKDTLTLSPNASLPRSG